MKFGMIVDCVFPHAVLDKCINSILCNTHPETIALVEDSFSEEPQCINLATYYNLNYIKSTGPRWQENNFAIPYFTDCDYIIISHSDIDFNSVPDWFEILKTAWANADPQVVALNMSVDAYRYYNGQPVYCWRQIPGNLLYGLAIDMHVQNRPIEEARQRTARLSPVSSFKMDFIKSVYPLDVDFDCELFLKITLAKKWSLWLNNPPILHLMGEHGGADTDIMIREIEGGRYTNDEYFAPLYRVQSEFKEKYGIELYDYLYHDFGHKYRNAAQIIELANSKKLYEFDNELNKIAQDILDKKVPSYEYLYA